MVSLYQQNPTPSQIDSIVDRLKSNENLQLHWDMYNLRDYLGNMSLVTYKILLSNLERKKYGLLNKYLEKKGVPRIERPKPKDVIF